MRNSYELICGSHVILSIMFLAVLSFSFFSASTASLYLWGTLSLLAETIRMMCSSTADTDHTFLLHIYFHSCLFVFYSMLFT